MDTERLGAEYNAEIIIDKIGAPFTFTIIAGRLCGGAQNVRLEAGTTSGRGTELACNLLLLCGRISVKAERALIRHFCGSLGRRSEVQF